MGDFQIFDVPAAQRLNPERGWDWYGLEYAMARLFFPEAVDWLVAKLNSGRRAMPIDQIKRGGLMFHVRIRLPWHREASGPRDFQIMLTASTSGWNWTYPLGLAVRSTDVYLYTHVRQMTLPLDDVSQLLPGGYRNVDWNKIQEIAKDKIRDEGLPEPADVMVGLEDNYSKAAWRGSGGSRLNYTDPIVIKYSWDEEIYT